MTRGPCRKPVSGWVVAVLAVAFGAGPRAAEAQYHQAGALKCSDCHTMHYSESGAPPVTAEAGGPWKRLLRASTVNKLCLLCHDGTDATAPDVLVPVGMYAGSGDEHSGGGYFGNSGGVASATSHDLDLAKVPPLSTKAAMTLTCTSCHGPHGTGNYRNLLTSPAGGAGTTVVLGTDVYENVLPAIPPTAAGSQAAYKKSNVGYKSSYSKWCAECHDSLAANLAGVAPAHFQRHPVNVALNAAGYHTDTANWIAVTPGGVGAATGDATYGVPRIRFQVSTAVSYATATTVAASNEVFCGSCHLAHGWQYAYALVWPYKEGGADGYAACQQCHNE